MDAAQNDAFRAQTPRPSDSFRGNFPAPRPLRALVERLVTGTCPRVCTPQPGTEGSASRGNQHVGFQPGCKLKRVKQEVGVGRGEKEPGLGPRPPGPQARRGCGEARAEAPREGRWPEQRADRPQGLEPRSLRTMRVTHFSPLLSRIPRRCPRYHFHNQKQRWFRGCRCDVALRIGSQVASVPSRLRHTCSGL